MMAPMSAILYPIAASPEAALAGASPRAARQKLAESLAGEAVAFVTAPLDPAFASFEAALNHHAGRLDDDRPGHRAAVAPEDRFCQLVQVMGQGAPAKPVQPSLKEGRRWPTPPPTPPNTVWRLQVSFWRPVSAAPDIPDTPAHTQARKARRGAREPVDPKSLRALTRQPLLPVKPQQPLDIGLFEVRLPENPNIIVPDE